MLSFYSLVDNPIFERHYSIDLICPSHFHNQVEMVYVLEGEIEIEVLEEKKIMSSKELALIFPNTLHRYHTYKHSTVMIFIFTPTLVHEFFQIFQTKYPVNPFLKPDELNKDVLYVMKAIQQWKHFYPHPESVDMRLIRVYLSMILYRVFEIIPLNELKLYELNEPIHKCLTYTMNHFRDQITLEHIAKEFGYSKYFISRIFSKKIGCSFNDYLNTLRVEFAENLLRNTTQSIDEICFQSGFNSLSSFYRAFKEICGTSPKRYKVNLICLNKKEL